MHNLFFNVCSCDETFEPERTRVQNTQFAVYISDTPVVLKQSQGHQTWNDNVDPKRGYNHAKFERSGFNGVGKKKATLNFV